ncbi:hypothetical protein U9M48_009087 [Paspalum notatum var. saurae]|uniref:Uncharacterized protein n=1 Tax=Paspalum notatum var. saurae TaxID=547442 RepID=A0AAQ3SQP8_PASNO
MPLLLSAPSSSTPWDYWLQLQSSSSNSPRKAALHTQSSSSNPRDAGGGGHGRALVTMHHLVETLEEVTIQGMQHHQQKLVRERGRRIWAAAELWLAR